MRDGGRVQTPETGLVADDTADGESPGRTTGAGQSHIRNLAPALGPHEVGREKMLPH